MIDYEDEAQRFTDDELYGECPTCGKILNPDGDCPWCNQPNEAKMDGSGNATVFIDDSPEPEACGDAQARRDETLNEMRFDARR